jgi:hypothetical protein
MCPLVELQSLAMPQTKGLDRLDLHAKFAALGPWATKFIIDGREYGGTMPVMGKPIMDQFFSAFPDCRRVLEPGCLEGAHSIELAARPHVRRVVAIDGKPTNLVKARFIQSIYGDQKIRFVEQNLETADLSRYGRFDVVLCLGILYHLPEPWLFLRQCREVSPNLFLATHYSLEAEAVAAGYNGRWYVEGDLSDPLSGLSARSFWPTRDDLLRLLTDTGYRHPTIIQDQPHPNGPLIRLAAKA